MKRNLNRNLKSIHVKYQIDWLVFVTLIFSFDFKKPHVLYEPVSRTLHFDILAIKPGFYVPDYSLLAHKLRVFFSTSRVNLSHGFEVGVFHFQEFITVMAGAQDFALAHQTNTSPRQSPHYDLEAQSTNPLSFSQDQASYSSLSESIRQRRPMRSNTVRTYRPERKGVPWQPGGEPGIDTSAIQDGQSFRGGPLLHEECEILVVDFSQDHFQMHRLDNKTLVTFMDQSRPDWVKCRWINVNGLSWDVIKLLGNDKGLHRLAIEDMLNTKNRTKADWYSDHTYSELFPDHFASPLPRLLAGAFSQRHC